MTRNGKNVLNADALLTSTTDGLERTVNIWNYVFSIWIRMCQNLLSNLSLFINEYIALHINYYDDVEMIICILQRVLRKC